VGTQTFLLAVFVIGLMDREGQKTRASRAFLPSTLSGKWLISKVALGEVRCQSGSRWLS
jgi:hypothetical protein